MATIIADRFAVLTTDVLLALLQGSRRTPNSPVRFASPERAAKVLDVFAIDGELTLTVDSRKLAGLAVGEKGKAIAKAVRERYTFTKVNVDRSSWPGVYVKALGNGVTLYSVQRSAADKAAETIAIDADELSEFMAWKKAKATEAKPRRSRRTTKA